MDPVHQARELFAQPFGAKLRLIGGLGILAFAGRAARVTHDIDVVADDAAATRDLREYLERTGWKIGDAGAYLRARKAAAPSIDVFTDPVANPRTFEAMKLSRAVIELTLDGQPVRVAAPDDLALLKLCAGRDQDAIDLAVLGSVTALDAARIVQSAEASDVEIRVAEGAHRYRNLVSRRGIDLLANELLARALSDGERAALSKLLDDLAGEGC